MTRTYATKAVPSTATPTVQSAGSRASIPIQAKASSPTLAQPLERSSQLGHSFEQADLSPESLQPATSGRPLPKPLREKMESSFNTDFSAVRVHEDDNAEKIGAMAYTRGENLHFAPSQFRPHSSEGQKIIGHELAHVMQQRSQRVIVSHGQDLPINTDPTLEAEADVLGTKAMQGDVAAFKTAISSGGQVSLQEHPIQAWGLKKKQTTKNDQDLQTLKDLGGGSANPVYKATYNNPIGSTNAHVGYFKPEFEPELDGNGNLKLGDFDIPTKSIPGEGIDLMGISEADARMSARAVASSRLDKHLGLNVLSEEVFATHSINGVPKSGSVSADVGGQELNQNLYENVVDQVPKGVREQDYKRRADGRYDEFTRTKLTNIRDNKGDVRATTQKSFSDLALLDAITNQTDRHGGNIKYDPETGLVKGIDNDIAFGKNVVQSVDAAFSSRYRTEGEKSVTPRDKAVRLPDLIDQATAKRVLGLKGKNLHKILNDGSEANPKLNDAEIDATRRRLKAVKAHIKELKRRKLLVGQKGGQYADGWGDKTLQTTLADERAQSSYLKGHLDSYTKPRSNQITEEAYNHSNRTNIRTGSSGIGVDDSLQLDSELANSSTAKLSQLSEQASPKTLAATNSIPDRLTDMESGMRKPGVFYGVIGTQRRMVKPQPPKKSQRILPAPAVPTGLEGKQEVDPPESYSKRIRFADEPIIKEFEKDKPIGLGSTLPQMLNPPKSILKKPQKDEPIAPLPEAPTNLESKQETDLSIAPALPQNLNLPKSKRQLAREQAAKEKSERQQNWEKNKHIREAREKEFRETPTHDFFAGVRRLEKEKATKKKS